MTVGDQTIAIPQLDFNVWISVMHINLNKSMSESKLVKSTNAAKNNKKKYNIQ